MEGIACVKPLRGVCECCVCIFLNILHIQKSA